MKIYTARHGQTDWNKAHRIQGRTDVPLNATGVRQAEELRERARGIELDICYSSPLMRAAETAKIIVDGKCEIVYDERLMERDFGGFEGEMVKDYKWTGLIVGDRYDRRADIRERDMEPISDLLARARGFLDRVLAENSADAQVLVVAHGGLLKALHYVIIGYDDDTDFWEFFLENGEVAEYDI